MRKLLFTLWVTMGIAVVSNAQGPERTMVTNGIINKIEAKVGDLELEKENQIIVAFQEYNKTSKTESARAAASQKYQDELKKILGETKSASLFADKKLIESLGIKTQSASTN